MGKQANLYGPPGSGKTRRLVGIAEQVVRERGPRALGAVTFTRTAAAELKRRLGPIAGVQDDARLLDRTFPFVGTIHSLALKLAGSPAVASNPNRLDWARTEGETDASFGGVDRADWLDTYDVGEQPRSAADWALQILSKARHRMVSFEQEFAATHADIPYGVETLRRLADSWEQYKRDEDIVDFEDMLVLGGAEHLPVEYLLVDEAQDNSPLLWQTLNRWSDSIPYTIAAGDPYQAIFQFSGAAPALFREQRGGWQTIDDSHRLTPEAAQFAVQVLREQGYADPLFETWDGTHDGSEKENGTEFYLARTNVLVETVARTLIDAGIPYAYINGRKGVIGSEPTAAYRAGIELREVGHVPMASLDAFVRALGRRLLGEPELRRVKALVRENPRGRARLADQPWRESIDRLCRQLPNADYYAQVVARHGMSALVLPPRTKIGTVHSAKGREADHVTLVRNWGTLPGKALLDGEASEACVAYVGVTRHRSTLQLLDLPVRTGVDFPFPMRYAA